MRRFPVWKFFAVVVVLLPGILFALPTSMGGVPNWWPSWLPSHQINRGLDLQGGLSMLLGVETDKAVEQTAENLVDYVRGILKEKRIRSKGVERDGLAGVKILLSDPADVAKIRDAMSSEISRYQVREETGVLHLTLTASEQTEVRQFAMDQSIQTIRSRIDQFGVAEPTIQKQGTERILLQLPGLKDLSRAKDLIGRTARLEFKMVDEKGDLSAALSGKIPAGDIVLQSEEKDKVSKQITKRPYLVKKRTVLAGDLLADARVNIDQFNEPYVAITFNALGGRKFSTLTSEHVGDRMAIVLDGKIYSAPVIRERIDGGRAQISGSFSLEEARDLAIVLRAGALPAPVKILEERTVGPSLGSDSIRDGVASCVIGLIMVVAFIGFYYRGFGALANFAVLLNLVLLVAVMVVLGATLTVPGIAGVVLSIGMAVDANVLINERIREELRLGRSPLSAVSYGYDKAFVTIWDSNLTTLITGVLLYQFGTGSIRGFAVTLSIGIAISMFTAITVTRMLLEVFLHFRPVKRLSIGHGMELIPPNTKIDFIRIKNLNYFISGLLTLIAIVSIGWQGFNFGIDFAGGTVVQVRFAKSAPVSAIRDALSKVGMGGAVIQEYGGPQDVLIRVGSVEGKGEQDQAKVATQIQEAIKPLAAIAGEAEIRRVEYVGPQVGRELTVNGILAVVYSWIAILAYVAWRFEFRFGLGAIIALIHDVTVVLGFFSITQREFSLVVVAAVLTVIGYSINDTIVIFDRIRDERTRMKKFSMAEIVNESVNRTLSRTIITSLVIVIVLVAMFFFGGEVIHDFSLAMLIGVVSGTYSSIYVASAIMLDYEKWTQKRAASNPVQAGRLA